MRLLAILSLALLINGQAWAQAASSESTQLPINVIADNGDFNSQTNIATYTGNVDITQGQMKLKGDKVVIHLQDGKVVEVEAWGNLAYFHYVPESQPPIDGKGLYMIYKVPQETIDIDGKAWVKQNDNETNADHLTYYLDKEQVQGKRINMTILPQEKGK